MAATFEDLISPATIASVRQAIVSASTIVSFAVESLPPLARLRKAMLDVIPDAIWRATAVQSQAIRGGLLDYAGGQWLDLLATNVYGLDGRIGASFATTPVAFTNDSATPYSFTALEVTVGNLVTKKTYRNAEPFELLPTETVTMDVIAVEEGSDSDADAGDISVMVTTFDGVSCTNPSVARGNDEETDAQIKIRCRASLSALSPNGAPLAYEYVALSALRTDGSAIGVTRVQVLEHSPNLGDVTVYVADADGSVAAPDVERINDLIEAQVRPLGVNYLGTFSATPVIVPITYSYIARSRDGLTAEEIEDLVEEALADLFANAPIGGYVITGPSGTFYRTEIISTISQTRAEPDAPMPIIEVDLLAPVGNLTLSPGQVATLGAVTVTSATFV